MIVLALWFGNKKDRSFRRLEEKQSKPKQ